MRELDALNIREYEELNGGKVDNEGRLIGGTMQVRKGIGNWHERETGKMMALRLKYQQGAWSTAADSPRLIPDVPPLPLKRTLGPFHLENLASFLETKVGANPELVEQVRAQAYDALISGDVKELRVAGIDPVYSPANDELAREQKVPYVYMSPSGSVMFFKYQDVETE